jgi:hypothetical protein
MKTKSTIITIILFNLILVTKASAVDLKDYSPYKYEVLFTNPICKTYQYRQVMVSNNGNELLSKPKNAYCKSHDSKPSVNRINSPHQRLIDWIRDEQTTEIFLAYLSFSNRGIAKELCQAIRTRSLKVTLVFDSNNESDTGRMATANSLNKCRPTLSAGDAPLVVTRGNVGGLGYAHNKLFFVNPHDKKAVRIAFSSGNMSSGTSTHHENWHFITTSSQSYFSKVHHCLMNGMLDHSETKKIYVDYVKLCRSKINATPENDIKVYFIPGDGKAAMSSIKKSIKASHTVEMAAHRFSNRDLISALTRALKNKKKIKLIVDDDMYYTGIYRQDMGRNTQFEFKKIDLLRKSGMKIQYMETYADDLFSPRRLQLQHNKFLIFHTQNNTGSIFAGAGNLTGSAFTKNLENFYHVSITEVYQAFKEQYKHMWNQLSTSYSQMPDQLALP